MESNIREQIADYVLRDFDIDEIEDTEENCDSLWINLKNGETYYIQVGACEKE